MIDSVINQEKLPLEDGISSRRKRKKQAGISLCISIAVMLTEILGIIYLIANIQELNYDIINELAVLLVASISYFPIFIVLLVLPVLIPVMLFKSINQIKVAQYVYTYKMNLYLLKKIINADELENKPEVTAHAKIYIIDDSIAYFGSANFTHYGFYKNFEILASTKNEETIKYLGGAIRKIICNWDCVSAESLGKYYFKENEYEI